MRTNTTLFLLLNIALINVPNLLLAQDPAKHGGAPPAGSGPVDLSGPIRVIDGNTIETRINGNQVGIGIIGITAPMGNTPCGKAATTALSALLEGTVHMDE